ncbi:hypothetical protein IE53DRAFT_88709 [Violaceomyces palustris]|uniref:Uncharacterized protein n=1 Tax=Violaceomyces palustris TaxID=1673888 RepID=A0ACD0NXS3_9BASI|nr:hypothetical protein IE53DRAFT_88709 [Violaceomyces palustris]
MSSIPYIASPSAQHLLSPTHVHPSSPTKAYTPFLKATSKYEGWQDSLKSELPSPKDWHPRARSETEPKLRPQCPSYGGDRSRILNSSQQCLSNQGQGRPRLKTSTSNPALLVSFNREGFESLSQANISPGSRSRSIGPVRQGVPSWVARSRSSSTGQATGASKLKVLSKEAPALFQSASTHPPTSSEMKKSNSEPLIAHGQPEIFGLAPLLDPLPLPREPKAETVKPVLDYCWARTNEPLEVHPSSASSRRAFGVENEHFSSSVSLLDRSASDNALASLATKNSSATSTATASLVNTPEHSNLDYEPGWDPACSSVTSPKVKFITPSTQRATPSPRPTGMKGRAQRKRPLTAPDRGEERPSAAALQDLTLCSPGQSFFAQMNAPKGSPSSLFPDVPFRDLPKPLAQVRQNVIARSRTAMEPPSPPPNIPLPEPPQSHPPKSFKSSSRSGYEPPPSIPSTPSLPPMFQNEFMTELNETVSDTAMALSSSTQWAHARLHSFGNAYPGSDNGQPELSRGLPTNKPHVTNHCDPPQPPDIPLKTNSHGSFMKDSSGIEHETMMDEAEHEEDPSASTIVATRKPLSTPSPVVKSAMLYSADVEPSNLLLAAKAKLLSNGIEEELGPCLPPSPDEPTDQAGSRTTHDYLDISPRSPDEGPSRVLPCPAPQQPEIPSHTLPKSFMSRKVARPQTASDAIGKVGTLSNRNGERVNFPSAADINPHQLSRISTTWSASSSSRGLESSVASSKHDKKAAIILSQRLKRALSFHRNALGREGSTNGFMEDEVREKPFHQDRWAYKEGFKDSDLPAFTPTLSFFHQSSDKDRIEKRPTMASTLRDSQQGVSSIGTGRYIEEWASGQRSDRRSKNMSNSPPSLMSSRRGSSARELEDELHYFSQQTSSTVNGDGYEFERSLEREAGPGNSKFPSLNRSIGAGGGGGGPRSRFSTLSTESPLTPSLSIQSGDLSGSKRWNDGSGGLTWSSIFGKKKKEKKEKGKREGRS